MFFHWTAWTVGLKNHAALIFIVRSGPECTDKSSKLTKAADLDAVEDDWKKERERGLIYGCGLNKAGLVEDLIRSGLNSPVIHTQSSLMTGMNWGCTAGRERERKKSHFKQVISSCIESLNVRRETPLIKWKWSLALTPSSIPHTEPPSSDSPHFS